MKRFLIIFPIILILVTLSPSLSTAQPALIPHENPATAQGSLGKAALLLSYGNFFNLASIKQYQSAQDMLNELKQVNIPDALRFIIDRYNTLCQQLLTSMNNLDYILQVASSLLSRNQIAETRQLIGEAEVVAHTANFLQTEIEAATSTISSKLGVATSSAEVKEAYERLKDSLNRLQILIDELNELREPLDRQQEIKESSLIPTELSLSVTPTSAYVGDEFTASGTLSSESRPLVGKKLTLVWNDQPITTTTSADGSYQANLPIPYRYVPGLTLTAQYIPSGADIDIYQSSQTQMAILNVLFYSTTLELTAPETAHPGKPLNISGQVSPNVDRLMRILWDDTQLAEKSVQGQFNLEIIAPPQTPTGTHKLTVTVTPEGRYVGASKNLSLNISKLPIVTEITTPRLVLIPSPVQINGRVYSDLGPISNASISLQSQKSLTTLRTSTDGSFSTSIDASPDLSLAFLQEVKVKIEPVEPWLTPGEIKKQIFTVNPANTGLTLVILISLGLIMYKRGRAKPGEEPAPQPQIPKPVSVTTPPAPRPKPTDTKGRILMAYEAGLEVIQKRTGISIEPHITLREFLRNVTPLIPAIAEPFEELTNLAEVALYSTYRLDEAMVDRANQFSATIQKGAA